MKLLLVEDHPLMREGLKLVLRNVEGSEVLEAGTLAAAVACASEHALDLILLDYHLPDCSGTDGLSTLQRCAPDCPIAILTAEDDRQLAQALVDAGARGFIPKSSSPALMLAALEVIRAGGVYMPTGLSGRTRAAIEEWGLSPRQVDVLRMLADGHTNRDIGDELGIAESTVRAHVTAIFRSLGVDNRTQAAAKALHLGIT